MTDRHSKAAAAYNGERASLFSQALKNYTDSDPTTNLIDLLADARHWCDSHQQSFASLDRLAYEHYLIEFVEALRRQS